LGSIPLIKGDLEALAPILLTAVQPPLWQKTLSYSNTSEQTENYTNTEQLEKGGEKTLS